MAFRRWTRAFVSALLLVAVGLPAARPAQAWERSVTYKGAPLGWDTGCVYWTLAEQSVDNRGFSQPPQPQLTYSQIRNAVAASFDVWEAVDCAYIRFEETEPGHCMDVGYHRNYGNANRIFFRSENWEDPDSPWRLSDQIALTSVFYDAQTGEIFDADIELNAEDFEFTTTLSEPRTDIQNALVHEIGHLLGLGHSSIREATMHLRASEGEVIKRTLHEDDREGLCSIYPLEEDPQTCAVPQGGLDLDCETAMWRAAPQDNMYQDVVFDEPVCCCDETGGLGHCNWEDDGLVCREANRHAASQLDLDRACEGERPSISATCCCNRKDGELECAWAQTSRQGNCEDYGVPASLVNANLICGAPPSSGGCRCSHAAPPPGSLGLSALRALFIF